jgi:SNF2 family DNA or RNA helicase
LIYHGMERELFEDFDVLVTSYGIIRSDIKIVSQETFEIAIFDEIQIAKNHNSKTNKALRKVRSKMFLGLTGTPIENRLRELEALFDIVLPNYLPNEAVFRNFFIIPIEKEKNKEKRKLLSKLIKPFVMRRKKQEVLLELPEKMEEISFCDLSQDQKKLYSEVVNLSKEKVLQDLKDKEKPINYMHIFALLSKLKQICDHPVLINKDFENYQKYGSGKWDLFIELINEARESNQKVVVFSQYLDMIATIIRYLKKQNIGYASIIGSTKERYEQIKKFKEDPKCEIFVASLLAAGVGIDLSCASIVIHYDRWWNPAKENQATDRVHRIGQTRGVQVLKLVTKNTVEERVHALIEQKKGLIEETIGKDEGDQIKVLSREELIAVLQEIQSKE